MTDPIADMLTRIRNAITARKAKVLVPASKLKRQLADVLAAEGFIAGVREEGAGITASIALELCYDQNNRNAIEGLQRVSRPGQRAYRRHDQLPRVRSGLGVAILMDAFIVRMVLVPAVMQLLGDKAWYMPKWLDRALPHLTIEAPESDEADDDEDEDDDPIELRRAA